MERWRWPVIGSWLAVTVAGAVFGGALFDRLSTTDTSRPDSESAAAQRRIDQIAPEGALVIGVIQGRDVYDPGLVASVTKAANELKAIDGVKDVDDLYTGPGGQIGADNRSTAVRVELDPKLTAQRREQVEDQVRARLKQIEAPTVLVGGTKVAERAFAEQAVNDLAVGESVAFAALLVALVVIFGGVVAAGIPLAVAVTAVTGTLLVLLGLSGATTVSEYSVNVVTLLGIGLAVDYSLLVVARFREERRIEIIEERPPGGTIAKVVGTAGRAVCVSGLAVACALAGLAAFAEPLLAAVALGGAAVVALTTLAALTLVPALLSVAQHRIPPAGAETWLTRTIDRLRRAAVSILRGIAKSVLRRQQRQDRRQAAAPQAPPPRRQQGQDRPRRRWGNHRDPRGTLARLAAFAQKRPGPVTLGVTLGLLVLATPLLGANFANSDARALPDRNEVRQAYDVLQSKFNNSVAAPVTVLVEADPGRADVRLFLNQLNRQPQVFRLELRRDVPAGFTVIDLTPKGETAGRESRDLVQAVRAIDAPFTKLVTGETAKVVDYEDSLLSRLPVAVGIVLVATMVLLYLLTGSLVVPLKALLMNVLTLAATLGVLIVLFQWGLGEVPLRFDSWGAVDLTTPVLLFVFVFGLSMDYEVFLLARIKEEYDRVRDNDRAVLAGITRSGHVVTAAAICICIVFLGFAAGGLVAVKEIGVGMMVAVILDVTVVRGLLLPGLMTMLDDWNWWAPLPLRRLHERLSRSTPPLDAKPVGKATVPAS